MWSDAARKAAAAKRRTQGHKALGSQSSAVHSRPGKPMKAPGVAKPTGPHAFTSGANRGDPHGPVFSDADFAQTGNKKGTTKKGQAQAISAAKKYGANKRRSATATRNAYAKVSDADFKAVMKGTKKPSRPRKRKAT